MSSNPLVPSFRYVNAIPTGAAHETVVQALKDHDDGIVDLQTAIPLLKNQITSIEKKISSSSSSSGSGSGSTATSGVSSFNAQTGAVEFFPDLGTVDDQTGETSYTLQDQDNGALLVLNDAGAVAVSLNPVLVNPFIVIVMNMGTGTVTFTATAPQVINSYSATGASSIPLLPGYLCVIALNGLTWNFGTLPIVPQNTPAVLHQWLASYNATTGAFTQTQPAFTDISGSLAASQLPAGTPVVSFGAGAPSGSSTEAYIYFDTSGSPYTGYVYHSGAWNPFN